MEARNLISPLPSAESYKTSRRRQEGHLSLDNRSRDLELPCPSSKRKSNRNHLHQEGYHHRRHDHHDENQEGHHHRRHDHHDENQEGHHHRRHDHHDENQEGHHHRRHYHHDEYREGHHHQRHDHHVDSSRRHHHRSSSQQRHSMSRSESLAMADKRHKASICARTSYTGKDDSTAPKRSKVMMSSSSEVGHTHRTAVVVNRDHKEHETVSGSKQRRGTPVDEDRSDDDRHFKWQPSKYNSSPPRGSRDRQRYEDRGGNGKKHR